MRAFARRAAVLPLIGLLALLPCGRAEARERTGKKSDEASRKLFDEVAAQRKEVERKREAYLRHVKRHGEDPEAGAHSEAILERQKLLDDAIVSMQRALRFTDDVADGYEPGSPEVKKVALRMVRDVRGDIVFWGGRGYRGVVLWLYQMLGRAWAYAGEPERAYAEGFDRLIDEDPRRYPVGAGRSYVNDLRMLAFYLKAHTAFHSDDYDTVIRTVERMLAPEAGFPDPLSDGLGNAAVIYRIRAYLEKDEPDHAAALADCRRVIRAGHDNWDNWARELAWRAEEEMRAVPPGRGPRRGDEVTTDGEGAEGVW